MKKIDYRIQRNNNLNNIYVSEDATTLHNGVNHAYAIVPARDEVDISIVEEEVKELFALHRSNDVRAIPLIFQKGPRHAEASVYGAIESDLLEIVRHRLQGHQKTEYATRENACALTHIEEALMWMSKRSDDRAERGVLGTTEK